jgi:hypothetical protein
MTDQGTQLATVEPERRINSVAVVEQARQALSIATNPAEIMQIEATLNAVEHLMRKTGLYPLDEIRHVNEERMRARRHLGAALASFVRGTGPGRGKKVSPEEKSFLN